MTDYKSELPLEARRRERHRPDSPVVMYQRWSELLFLHWAVPPEVVQAGLPEGLTVDTYEGQAWIGVVPFLMHGVRPRGLPPVPALSNFPELNLRTYVYDHIGRPGVWFYSLDTPNSVANWIARTFFHLNYRTARMEVRHGEREIDCRSELKQDNRFDEAQHYRWRREGRAFEAEPGSLEFFLAERYRLFAYDWKSRRLFSGRVHHVPYPLQAAKVSQYSKRLFSLSDLEEPDGGPDHTLCSAGVPITVHPLARVAPIQG
ncbi:YqjF family protein [Coraliomargarita sinensis]|nr:DUF2071 domain-containing protein [Coraliomargarita sinensis]